MRPTVPVASRHVHSPIAGGSGARGSSTGGSGGRGSSTGPRFGGGSFTGGSSGCGPRTGSDGMTLFMQRAAARFMPRCFSVPLAHARWHPSCVEGGLGQPFAESRPCHDHADASAGQFALGHLRTPRARRVGPRATLGSDRARDLDGAPGAAVLPQALAAHARPQERTFPRRGSHHGARRPGVALAAGRARDLLGGRGLRARRRAPRLGGRRSSSWPSAASPPSSTTS
jgi:hypothetical protein